ncbi:hypothetical protein [Halomontanus rarus]|nr:hypothetical protein [Halovivax sp. TS33]
MDANANVNVDENEDALGTENADGNANPQTRRRGHYRHPASIDD